MLWEVWDVETGNIVGFRDTEAEALALVRDLVDKGWPMAALSLLADDESLSVYSLPPAVSGDELARKADLTGEGPSRRTA